MIRPKMTFKKLRESILQSRGTGQGDHYRPWIEITKRNTSTTSMQSTAHMPGTRRLCHYLSLAELDFAHLLWWLGAKDVREQFPMWPWPHPHPLDELHPDTAYPPHRGMTAVAEAAGIRLFLYPGLQVPAILTVDLVATFREGESLQLFAYSCKPAEIVRSATPSDRVLARLELDRRYWMEAGVPHRLVHAEQLPRLLMAQLQWLAPVDPSIDTFNLTSSSEYITFVGKYAQHAYGMPAFKAAKKSATGLGWNDYLTSYAMRLAMWRLDVDVNPLEQIVLTSPLKPGGRRLRAHFRSKLL